MTNFNKFEQLKSSLEQGNKQSAIALVEDIADELPANTDKLEVMALHLHWLEIFDTTKQSLDQMNDKLSTDTFSTPEDIVAFTDSLKDLLDDLNQAKKHGDSPVAQSHSDDPQSPKSHDLKHELEQAEKEELGTLVRYLQQGNQTIDANWLKERTTQTVQGVTEVVWEVVTSAREVVSDLKSNQLDGQRADQIVKAEFTNSYKMADRLLTEALSWLKTNN